MNCEVHDVPRAFTFLQETDNAATISFSFCLMQAKQLFLLLLENMEAEHDRLNLGTGEHYFSYFSTKALRQMCRLGPAQRPSWGR